MYITAILRTYRWTYGRTYRHTDQPLLYCTFKLCKGFFLAPAMPMSGFNKQPDIRPILNILFILGNLENVPEYLKKSDEFVGARSSLIAGLNFCKV